MGSQVFSAHESFFTPDPVVLHDLFVVIGQQREWKFEFLDKSVVRLDGVGAHAQNNGAALSEFLEVIAKGAGFLGATGRVVFWVKIENDVLPFKIGQGNFSATTGCGGKRGSLVSFFKGEFWFFWHNEI